MKLLSSNKSIENKIIKLIKKYDEIYIVSAWATLSSKAANILIENKKHITKMVVGINGYSTSPEFIKEFRDCKNIKYSLKNNGIFHPKIYLFFNSKKEWECLIGSANFTNGGMKVNTELMVHTFSHDNDNKSFIDNLLKEINKYYSLAYRMTDEKYNIYLQDFNLQKSNKKNTEDSNKQTEEKMSDISIKNLLWKEFYQKAEKSTDGSLEERLDLLKYVKEYFIKYISLKNMPHTIVKQIAGTVSYGEHNIEWMYFGNMVSPYFRKQIILSLDIYSEALDLIPLNSEISRKNYMNFVQFIEENVPYGYGVITLSRLLAMKRPDVFYCITSNNEYPLYRDFNIKPLKSDDFERYWDEIILNIHNSNWYKSDKPSKEKEIAVWNVRAAMLDIITY